MMMMMQNEEESVDTDFALQKMYIEQKTYVKMQAKYKSFVAQQEKKMNTFLDSLREQL